MVPGVAEHLPKVKKNGWTKWKDVMPAFCPKKSSSKC